MSGRLKLADCPGQPAAAHASVRSKWIICRCELNFHPPHSNATPLARLAAAESHLSFGHEGTEDDDDDNEDDRPSFIQPHHTRRSSSPEGVGMKSEWEGGGEGRYQTRVEK